MTARRGCAGLLTILVVVAIAVRLGWVFYQGPAPAVEAGFSFPDERVYWNLAESIARGDGLVDEFGYRATYMPGYPAFLSIFVGWPHALLTVRIVQAVLGGLVVIPVYRLGEHLSGVALATLAGLLVAVDPFLVGGFSHLLLTETLFTTCLAGAIYLSWPLPRGGQPWHHAGSGGLLWAACIYLRPSSAVLAAVWLLATFVLSRTRARTFGHNVMTAFIILVALLPWAERNRHVVGAWIWLTTRDGISLYDGLGPRATGASDLAYTKAMPQVRGLSELEWRDHFRHAAWQAARDDPARAVRLAWTKLTRTWSFVPNEPSSRTPLKMWVSAIWMIATLGLAVIGAARLRCGRTILLLLLAALYFTVLHMVFVGSIRYRVPVMPLVYVLGGFALRPAPRAAPQARGAVSHG